MRTYASLAVALALAGCRSHGTAGFRTEPITRGPVAESVNATGEVSAIVIVNVGSQVSGTVSQLLVDFNSLVKKGQLLATIDPRLFQAQLEKAEASVASAVANVEKSQVALNDAIRAEKRQRELRQQGLVSQADLDTAIATREGAAAALSGAKAAVLQARADRELARANVAYTRITSPIDGIVVSRSIDVGQTVAAAFQAPTLFMIANDLTKMQILANIDEADVGKVRDGLEARFTVDAYPGEQFTGRIREVRQAPTTIQNVVTYAAVIDAPNPDRKLRQGMTASVTVTAARQEDVLRVPNAALRWKPDEGAAPAPAPDAGTKSGGERTLARAAPVTARPPRPEAAGRPEGGGRVGRVFKVSADGQPVPVTLRLGLSDGKQTEVLEGLVEGDRVIVGGSDGASGANRQGGPRRGPF